MPKMRHSFVSERVVVTKTSEMAIVREIVTLVCGIVLREAVLLQWHSNQAWI